MLRTLRPIRASRGAVRKPKRRLDLVAFRRNRLSPENPIEFKSIERAQREKPVPTFSLRALAEELRTLMHDDEKEPNSCGDAQERFE